jgi:hypothetical protein
VLKKPNALAGRVKRNEMTKEQVNKFLNDKHMSFDYVAIGKVWKGVQVWEPGHRRPRCTGLPIIVIEDHGKLRFASTEESFAYLDFAYPNDDAEKYTEDDDDPDFLDACHLEESENKED